MREARIILPVNDNEHHVLEEIHNKLRKMLCLSFGGYTAQSVYGGWVSDTGEVFEEPSIAYDVAMDPDPAKEEALRNIAKQVGHEAKQLAMYVRHASGEVEILETVT
jgi:hypothetical protein